MNYTEQRKYQLQRARVEIWRSHTAKCLEEAADIAERLIAVT